jgi:hypothetical protein
MRLTDVVATASNRLTFSARPAAVTKRGDRDVPGEDAGHNVRNGPLLMRWCERFAEGAYAEASSRRRAGRRAATRRASLAETVTRSAGMSYVRHTARRNVPNKRSCPGGAEHPSSSPPVAADY